MVKTGERSDAAELSRIKGALLLQQAVPDVGQAEACFQQALAVARRQQARSLELRAAVSLARLWQQQGRRAEAYALLAPVYGWFTEGFDTADLQEAKALLAELVGERSRLLTRSGFLRRLPAGITLGASRRPTQMWGLLTHSLLLDSRVVAWEDVVY